MPLVRIDIPSDTPREEQVALSDAIHAALVATFNVLLQDRFQTIHLRTPSTQICTDEFLGITHSQQVVFVQIFCAIGRSTEVKKDLYARLASEIAERTTFKSEDVIINLVETARENWSFGNGVAQFAQ